MSEEEREYLNEMIRSLNNRLVDALRERDEARREVLLWVKERCSWVELTQEIKQRKWEYLQEDGNA